ncbi:IS3 family transposase [Proteiniclasticum sp. BAD-10]|uniref:IS3 family transposase n=1 Tax=Proteiniclasticum sediminis TaxID=2804028 RepID=A0A941CR72_9CLOT|nr:IS3 family transposase [Proteiniclasticum sediminis]
MDSACALLEVSKSAYYKWVSHKRFPRELKNEEVVKLMEKIHQESPDKGYRRIRDDLIHDYHIQISDKKALRLCRLKDLKSTIKYKTHSCTRRADNPQHLAENLLNREFHASKPNEKWLTDVTEFHYYEGVTEHKVYLSAILDLNNRRIVAFAIQDHNDNRLVFDTFDQAMQAHPNADPLFHRDRGYQYTNRTFYHKFVEAGMTRGAPYIDNGPMKGFWWILQREWYYG